MIKKLPIISFFVFTTISFATNTIDGNAFLENLTDHSGIQVVFEQTAPSTSTDTSTTNASGYFTAQLENGIYDITYSKDGFVSGSLTNQTLFANTTLSDITLLEHNTLIQTAIDAALDGDTVLVQPGTYVENINYNGKNIVVGSLFLTTQDTSYISSTIIDGNESGSVVTFESGETSSAKLIGFTIQNGQGTGTYPNFKAGGITLINNSNPLITNCIITGNSSSNESGSTSGGGFFIQNSSPILEYLSINNNNATYQGGGIWAKNSDLIIRNTRITDNNTSLENTGALSLGGGIYLGFCDNPVLTNVLIEGNIGGYGGGIGFDSCDNPYLLNVTITGNATAYFGSGGGITFNSSNPTLTNVTISDNTAYIDGGGIYCYDNSSPSLVNTIVSDNTGNYGIYVGSGTPSITYSDLYNNENGNCYGCGDWVGVNVMTNANGDSCDLYYNIQEDPLFVDSDNGDYNLQQGSPCIDGGDPTSPFDPDGSIVDMGAFPSSYGTSPIYSVIHVSTTGSDSNDGSEASPYATIQKGIDVSSSNDTVLVQSGTYVENINYIGKNIVVGSLYLTTSDTSYISSTIIDGNQSGSVVTFGNNEDSTAILIGFTIQNGSGFSLDNTLRGGGIYCYNSDPTMTHVAFSENTADLGGGMYCYSSDPTMTHVVFSENTTANGEGGGLYVAASSSPTLTNVTFRGNTANTAGGMYVADSSPTLTNVTFSGNTADLLGGANGGGVLIRFSNPTLTNVTFSGNTADLGGGMYLHNASPTLTNATFSGNSGTTNGGGIYNYFNSSPSLVNCILWNDSPQEIYISSGSVTATYSNIEGGYTGTGNIDSDPLFCDTLNNDFTLYDNSPCVGTGENGTNMGAHGVGCSGGPYSGPVWYVSTTGSDSNEGSEASPFATIQTGIDSSSNGDTVLVAAGTYVENINYNGKNISVIGEDSSNTIIDGNQNGRVVTFESGEDSTAILIGFTIQNGSHTDGGGIYCNNSNPTLTNVKISGNNASNGGGGIYCINSSNPTLTNVTINGNASNSGGGIYCNNSSNPTITNTTISNNYASFGGGMYLSFSEATLINVTISGHTTGSGMYLSFSEATLINSIIWGNGPESIYTEGSFATIITYSDIEGGYTGIGNIDTDPLFCNADNNDFTLYDNSPCVGTGENGTNMGAHGVGCSGGPYSGPVWYVSTTGSDSNDGSEASPFATIQTGIDSSSNGDTVLVAAGTYVENINYNGKNISIIGEDSSNTIIDGNQNGRVVTFESGEDSTTALSGFTITNGDGIIIKGSSPTLQNLNITNNTPMGGIEIAKGNIYNGHASSSSQIKNTIISYNYTQMEGGGVNISEFHTLLFQNVLIYGNSSQNGSHGFYSYESNSTLINVTIADNSSGSGLDIGASDTLTLINSIIWNNEIVNGGAQLFISYSNIQGGWGGTGNIDADPLFVDPANDNYNLQWGSPAIDAGDPDLDGDGFDYTTDTDDRDPDGTRMDMGAYYFIQNDTIPPTVQLLSPVMNTELIIGEVTQITWSADDNYLVDYLNIEYTTDALSWTVIAENEVDDGEYDWLVPNTPSSSVSLRILAFDPGGRSDTAQVENLTITIMTYPIVIQISPSTNHLTWRDNQIMVTFSQAMDSTTFSMDNITIQTNHSGDLNPAINTINSAQSFILDFPQSFASLDTVTLTLSSLTNNFGLEFDGDGDQLPGGDYSFTYNVGMLADYDTTSSIDAFDLATFVQSLNEDDHYNELGPVTGTAPHFMSTIDSNMDIEDAMAFVMMWNWYVTNNGGLLRQLADFGEPVNIEATHDSLYFDLPPGVLAYEVQVQHNPEIISFGTVESNSTVKLQSTDKEVGLFNLINAPNEQTHVSIPINISGKKTDITFVIRAIGHDNTIISQQTSNMTVHNIPEQFALHHNYPNPFNPVTTIQYDIPVDADVILVIYDILGRHVKTLVHTSQTAGYKSINWNGTNDHGQLVSAGMYFYNLQTIGYSKVRKMVLLK